MFPILFLFLGSSMTTKMNHLQFPIYIWEAGRLDLTPEGFRIWWAYILICIVCDLDNT